MHGKPARRLSPELLEAHGDIPLHRPIGLRNHLVHEYDKVKLQVVWDTVMRDLPGFEETIANLVEQ